MKLRKVYLNQINEDWVVDRFRKEWYEFNSEISSEKINNSDIVWIIAPWMWKKLSKRQLLSKKVICTIHHIDFDKFGKKEEKDFYNRDKFVDEYHVISDKTKKQVEKLTTKKINVIPFWVNQDLWFQIKSKDELFKKFNFNNNNFYIGSFQRDTEGSDLVSPKLSKGPDIFLEVVKHYKQKINNIEVVLTGRRRNYIIQKLEENNIKFSYFEMVDFKTLNELYNCLNLYVVSSRVEGGPQSIMECASTMTPLISTDVGIANEILSNKSIYNIENLKNAEPDTLIARKNVEKFFVPNGFIEFKELINKI